MLDESRVLLIQMLTDVYPFIQEKILPQLQDPFKQVRAER